MHLFFLALRKPTSDLRKLTSESGAPPTILSDGKHVYGIAWNHHPRTRRRKEERCRSRVSHEVTREGLSVLLGGCHGARQGVVRTR